MKKVLLIFISIILFLSYSLFISTNTENIFADDAGSGGPLSYEDNE